MKPLIVDKICENLRLEQETAKRAADSAREGATHEDAKAENQYDTRGLEASYLAGAQAERVMHLSDCIGRFKNIVLKDFSKGVLFELNDETTRLNFTTQVNNYMRDIQARRGMTDFLVVADTTNNTADVIDRNEFVADIYIKPSRSINFITLTFVATRTGVSFNEVIGRV